MIFLSDSKSQQYFRIFLSILTDFCNSLIWFDLVSVFKGISTVLGYLMPKSSL